MKNNSTGWLTLLGITTAIVLFVACSGSSSRGGEGNGNDTMINVLVKGFSFSLEPSQTEAGKITFVVQNDDSIHHDFAIQANDVKLKTPMIAPGKSATLTMELESGSYTYLCSIPGHEQLGMVGTFTVTSD